MSQENVEIVRKGLDAYRRRDLAAAFASIDPEISWNPAEEVPRRGIEAVRSNLERWEEVWDDYQFETEDLIDAGDRVLVTLHFRGRGRGSDIEIETRSHQVYTLRDGRAVRMDEYLDRSEALEAAGLSE